MDDHEVVCPVCGKKNKKPVDMKKVRKIAFSCVASVLLLDVIRKRSETAFSITSGALLASALVLFAAFYPLESGLPCSREYAKYLRWFKWYNY